MAGMAAARQLDDVTQALESQLHSLTAQVNRLKQCSAVLGVKNHQQARPLDKGTQADDGPTINPLRYVKAAPDTLVPFTFQAPSQRINWKRLRGVQPQHMLADNDTAGAMQLLEDVAYGDAEGGSIYERSEANLLKLLQLAQLQLQFLHYKLQEKLQTEQVLEDDALALAAGLSSLAPPSLTDISSGLGGIQANLQQLGCSRVDGLIGQVRAEERSAAKAALTRAIEQTKHHMGAKYHASIAGHGGTAAASAAGTCAAAADGPGGQECDTTGSRTGGGSVGGSGRGTGGSAVVAGAGGSTTPSSDTV